MTFVYPVGLLLLIPVVLLAVSYLLALRRKTRYAVRYAALPLLDSVIPEKPSWRRHVPAGLLILSLGLVSVAAARPEMPVRVPYERATIVVALDVSESMMARDVAPDRLTAAVAAAANFIDQLPENFNVGVVTFSGTTRVVHAPDTDHAAASASLRSVTTESRTAIGEGVFAALDQIDSVIGVDDEPLPAHVVLLSDGTNTVGRNPGLAAEAAVLAGVPVSTIAYGTESGVLDLGGYLSPVPVDEESLAELATLTNGTAYTAESSDELEAVYRDIGSSIGWRTEWREVTAVVAGVAVLCGLIAGALSLRWFSRLV